MILVTNITPSLDSCQHISQDTAPAGVEALGDRTVTCAGRMVRQGWLCKQQAASSGKEAVMGRLVPTTVLALAAAICMGGSAVGVAQAQVGSAAVAGTVAADPAADDSAAATSAEPFPQVIALPAAAPPATSARWPTARSTRSTS